MGDFILNLLNSPLFVTLATTLLSTIAVDSTISGIKQIKDVIKDMPHEAQLLDCLEQALFATENKLGWKHKTEAMYETFLGSLMSFAGKCDRDSLTRIFKNAVDIEVTDDQVELWIENVIKQISLPVHTDLREFLKIHNLFNDNQVPSQFVSRYILTPNAPVCENPDIIFRDTIVHDLLKKVSVASSRIQIAGMGGLGKTEILNKLYAQLAKDKKHTLFDHIALITFSGEIASDIEAQVDYPRPYLGLQGVEAAKRFLQDICQEKNILLCIDDIRPNQTKLKRNDPNLVFLRSLGASILLTSRVSYPEFEVLDLNFLPTEACISIFKKKYERTISDAGDIAILTDIIENRAGNHTMIINRLGNMAKDHIWSIPVLSDNLKKDNFNFSKGIDDDELLQQEINKLYQINEQFTPAEVSILEAFSIFPASPLSKNLCVDWLHEDAGVDEDKCALLLNKLAEQTWLEKRCGSSGSDVYFLMHQLVRTAVQEQSSSNIETHLQVVNHCRYLLRSSTKQYDFSKAASIIPFALSIFRVLLADEVSLAYLSFEIANYYSENADYFSALECNKKALVILEKVLGKDHPDTATTYGRIAEVYNSQGQYDLALEWFKKDLAISERILGKDHPNTATTYHNIAEVCKNLGQYDLALEWNQKALVIRERVLGKDHPDTATTYNNIALVYKSQGKYDLALEWYMKDLAISERVLGKDHPDTAVTYNNIAGAYRSKGQYDLALEWSQKALVIRERVFGKDHPNTASCYKNIAGVYYSKGQYDLALEWYQKALVIYEKILGKSHPDTASIYNSIAGVYNSQGQYDLALEWYQKALVICKKMLGKNHPFTASTYNNIASVYKSQGQYDLALKWLLKDLVISMKVLGKDHPDTAITYNNIAAVYDLKGQNDLALEWYLKALPIFQSALGSEHQYTISTGKAVFTLEKLAKTE